MHGRDIALGNAKLEASLGFACLQLESKRDSDPFFADLQIQPRLRGARLSASCPARDVLNDDWIWLRHSALTLEQRLFEHGVEIRPREAFGHLSLEPSFQGYYLMNKQYETRIRTHELVKYTIKNLREVTSGGIRGIAI